MHIVYALSAVGLSGCHWGLSQLNTFLPLRSWKDLVEEELVCIQTFSKV